MSDHLYIGIDLGGTAIKVGICDDEGQLVHQYKGPTQAEKGAEHVIQNIIEYVTKAVEDSPYRWEQVAGIGAGIAGFLDIPQGRVRFSPNLGWENIEIQSILEEQWGKPVRIDNDANVAALGETLYGAGRGFSNAVCYTLGTGIGGGIIINRKIYQGCTGMAGEIGHLSVVPDIEAIQCRCGQMGCLETVASATGIVHMAQNAVERKEKTSLAMLENMTAKDVIDAAKEGDEVAIRIVKRAAHYLGKSMAMLAIIINPEIFIVGGGVSAAGDILLEPVRETFKHYCQKPAQEGVDIVPAKLGNDAGMIGAARLAATSS